MKDISYLQSSNVQLSTYEESQVKYENYLIERLKQMSE